MRDHSKARGGGTFRAWWNVFAEIRFTADVRWCCRAPALNIAVAMGRRGGEEYALEPLMDDQELDARASTGTVYWEGAVRALRGGREVGRGYLELTGYGKPLTL
jgi:hypothetical protein